MKAVSQALNAHTREHTRARARARTLTNTLRTRECIPEQFTYHSMPGDDSSAFR